MLRKIVSQYPIRSRILNQNFLSSSKTYSQSQSSEVIEKVSTENAKVLLSDSCVKRLKAICDDGSFLRITVEGGGCSGFQYKFEIDNSMKEDDITFGSDKAKVVVDSVSLEYCSGSTVDYHTELIKSGFRIVGNPKAEQGCSCGASFSFKMD